MRRAVVVVVLALLLPAPCASGDSVCGAPHPLDFFPDGTTVLVAEVYYRALRADEYVALTSAVASPIDLSGWTLGDGEGTLTFPPGSSIAPGQWLVVAQNSTAYYEDTLREADYQYRGGNATPMERSGTFQLRNDGDEVFLRDASGGVVDLFAYGDSAYADEGWSGPPAAVVYEGYVARRAHDGSWRDTNSSADWDLVRVRSLGQSDLPAASFAFEGEVLAFVAPDGSSAAIAALLATANETIDVNVYTMTNAAVGEALRAALARGVRVRILLEGGPVGGISADEWDLMETLAADGAEIRFFINDTSLDIQGRFRYGHAKYAVVDRRTTLVSSENWGNSGYPPTGTRGSRGWSLAVTHEGLAAYFTRAFEEDFDARRRDVRDLAAMNVTLVEPGSPSAEPFEVRFPPKRFEGTFRAEPVLGPDATLAAIPAALRNATRTVHAEVFYAHRAWGPFPNLYLEALLAAARRGVEVRLLLDASTFNLEEGDPNDNDDAIAYLLDAAAREGLDLEAKLVDLDAHGLAMLHNKGFVVDGRTVLVSSVNWNRNSATANREAGLLVTNEALAAYFEAVFAWDWNDDLTPPIADAGPDRTVMAGATVAFSALGSWDNVGVANATWDFDGDETDDAWGSEVAFAYERSGTFTVRLRVADGAGNAAEDAAIVTVLEPEKPTAPTPLWPTLLAAGVVALAIAAFALVRRRRIGLSKPPG